MTGVQTCALPICFPVTIIRAYIVANDNRQHGENIVENPRKQHIFFNEFRGFDRAKLWAKQDPESAKNRVNLSLDDTQ